MKKSAQIAINENVLDAWKEAKEALDKNYPGTLEWKRLRNCDAYVYVGPRFTYLKSFKTVVAFIDRELDTSCVFDVLRYVYCYTNCSSMHIAKFTHDYAGGEYGWIRRYYPV